MEELMRIEGLKMYFGGLKAIDGFDLTINKGETLGIIGPNGAGKTTLFNAICGVYKPTAGKVILEGFQISKPLRGLTIFDNIVAAAGVQDYTGIGSYFHRSHTKEVEDKVEAIIHETGLAEVANKKASDVSLGYLRRLEIARVLVTEPKLIMLDEPCAGLSNFAINEITELIFKLKEQNRSIVLIEHNLPLTMRVCDRITVLSYGKKICEGTPEYVKNDEQVIEAYLGKEDED